VRILFYEVTLAVANKIQAVAFGLWVRFFSPTTSPSRTEDIEVSVAINVGELQLCRE